MGLGPPPVLFPLTFWIPPLNHLKLYLLIIVLLSIPFGWLWYPHAWATDTLVSQFPQCPPQWLVPHPSSHALSRSQCCLCHYLWNLRRKHSPSGHRLLSFQRIYFRLPLPPAGFFSLVRCLRPRSLFSGSPLQAGFQPSTPLGLSLPRLPRAIKMPHPSPCRLLPIPSRLSTSIASCKEPLETFPLSAQSMLGISLAMGAYHSENMESHQVEIRWRHGLCLIHL